MLEVYQGSTSESAGIKVGDIITAVNGTNVANMDQDDLRALIDAKKADGVQLSILRGSETLDITVTGGNITVKHVDSALFNDRTGYIYVSMFTGNCADEFENAIKDLKSRNMKSLVIDLRNNPGGSLDIVVRVGEILLGKGMRIVSVGPTDSTEETVYNGKGSAIGVPVAVIVNENSASASEILAAAIQENEIGVVVGTNTYGKGVVQTTSYIESTGGWLKITTDAYYTPNGNNINGVGISPDILMELPEQYLLGAEPAVYAVYTLNGGAQQESTSVRVKAEITGLAELLEQSVGTKLEAARDVEPGSSAWLLAGISVGCTIGAAVVTVLVLRVHSRLKKRRKTARHHKKA